VAELERQLGQNSGNSAKPPSPDAATERQRQAEERTRRAEAKGGAKRRRGKQLGAKGKGLEMSATPDAVVDHRPPRCQGCGDELGSDAPNTFAARQVIELPEVAPVVTEHRAHSYRCGCGRLTRAAFPPGVRAPVSYGPRTRAVVAYLLARQHLPTRRVAETIEDLFGLRVSTGAVDSVYSEASRPLGGSSPPWWRPCGGCWCCTRTRRPTASGRPPGRGSATPTSSSAPSARPADG
jgi:transposase